MSKKRLIMEKSLELFAKQGFEATSIQQITDFCGISKGAFYLSFKSKDELIVSLIDQFMMQLISDIEHTVNNTTDNERLLYEFYYTTFDSFRKNSDFFKILIKEQSHSFNEELILKIRYYNGLTEKTILSLIERLYKEEIKSTKYDLIYCIKGFMHIYSELFLFYNTTLDLDLLSQSLVEKTNLLARNTTIPFISEELFKVLNQPTNEEITKEQLLEAIEHKLEELEDSIEKESLVLLKQHLIEPSLSLAIVKGLMGNIQKHSACKWVSYLLHNYFQI